MDEDKVEDCCGICLEKMVLEECGVPEKCPDQHMFHTECLLEWAKRLALCPLCKREFDYIVSKPENKPIQIVPRPEVEDDICQVCQDAAEDDLLLICDGCDALSHLGCAGLSLVPDGDWFCSNCAQGRASAAARAARDAAAVWDLDIHVDYAAVAARYLHQRRHHSASLAETLVARLERAIDTDARRTSAGFEPLHVRAALLACQKASLNFSSALLASSLPSQPYLPTEVQDFVRASLTAPPMGPTFMSIRRRPPPSSSSQQQQQQRFKRPRVRGHESTMEIPLPRLQRTKHHTGAAAAPAPPLKTAKRRRPSSGLLDVLQGIMKEKDAQRRPR